MNNTNTDLTPHISVIPQEYTYDELQEIQKELQEDVEFHKKCHNLLSEGQVFKNYKALCLYLGEEIKDGKSKNIQLKNWERFFTWERNKNEYIIKEIKETPQSRVDKRKEKELGGYSDIINTIMIYMLMYGKRDNPYGYSYTKTQLRKDVLKLVNKDYYNIRRDGSRASRELDVDPRTLYFLDNQVSDRMRKMSDRGIRALEEEGVVDRSKERFIQYIDLGEYRATGEKRVITRKIEDDEYEYIQMMLTIAACGKQWEKSEKYFKFLNEGEFFYKNQEFEEKENGELKKSLWIANEGRKLEDGDGEGTKSTSERRKRIKEYERKYKVWHEQLKEYLSEGGKKEITPQEEFLFYCMSFNERLKEEGEEFVIKGKEGELYYTDKGIERFIGESESFGYARKRGEYWVNMFEKTLIIPPTQSVLMMTFLEKMEKFKKDGKGRIITMPEAQLKLNEMTKEWIYDKVRDEGKWVDFKNKFRIERGTGSDDLKKDAEEFIRRYIAIENVEPQYRWRGYEDENGKVWKVRYADNEMTFNKNNLNGAFFIKKDVGKGEIREYEDEDVILWSVPQDGMLCTNCKELVDLARSEWDKRGWFPIQGYLGGIWDEEKNREMNCFILVLGSQGLVVLKELWEKEKERINELF